VACAVGIAVVAGVAGGAIWRLTEDDNNSAQTGTNAQRCPAISIANDVLPTVVTVEVHTPTSSSNGSGEIIRDNGYILTNDHVISPAAGGGTIDVVFSSGESESATIVGRTPTLDLAVVKVNAPSKVPVIGLGHSESLQVGQPVVALGAPLGLSGTVTSGIVSALGRDVPVPGAGGQTAILPGAVQTDAAINPGNSGGALVDCDGNLVGVNTAIATVPNAAGQAGGGSVGIGFAIPVDLATVVADQLIDTGRFVPPYLGVSTVPIPGPVADRFGVTDGLFVQSVSPNGPAAQAGLQAGDIITHLDGKPTTGPDSLLLGTLTKKAGDQVTVDYLRDGQAAKATVTLAAQP
jgi:putative serine protease PepD